MFDFYYLLLVILLSIGIYLVFNLYAHNTKQIEKLTLNLNESIEIECENITDAIEIKIDEIKEKLNIDDLHKKIVNIEELINTKLSDCNNKINELFSLQNKINEVTKMNNQSIINQFDQFDGDTEDKDQNFNSIDNSPTQNQLKSDCFIKLSQIKNPEKNNRMFYMSPENNNNTSQELESISEKIPIKKTMSIDNDKYNNNIPICNYNNESENNIVLEITGDFIKTNCMANNNSKANNVFRILNESSNIIKNNSFLKLASGDLSSCKSSNFVIESDNGIQTSGFQSLIPKYNSHDDETDENLEHIIIDDPPLVQTNLITMNKYSMIEIN